MNMSQLYEKLRPYGYSWDGMRHALQRAQIATRINPMNPKEHLLRVADVQPLLDLRARHITRADAAKMLGYAHYTVPNQSHILNRIARRFGLTVIDDPWRATQKLYIADEIEAVKPRIVRRRDAQRRLAEAQHK